MNDILCIGLCVLNFLTASFFFYKTLDTKAEIKVTLAVWFAYISVIFVTVTAVFGITIENLVFFYIIPIFPSFLVFKDEMKRKIVFAAAYLAIGFVCFLASFVLYKNYSGQPSDGTCVSYSLFTALLSIFVSLLVFFRNRTFSKIPCMMFSLRILADALFFSFISCVYIKNSGENKFAFVFAVALAFCFNLLFYIAFDLFLRGDMDRKRLDFRNAENERKYEYYKLALENEKNVSCMRHDIGNTLEAAFALLRGGNAESGEKLLTEFCKDYPKPMKYCENEIINVILTLKLKEMTEKGITGNYDIEPTISDVPLRDSELSSVLSNLIDNAIRAADGCYREKSVFVTIHKKHGFLIIKTENSSNDTVEDSEDICTTKEDSKNHGYGLKIIKETVKRHGGNFGIGNDRGKVSAVATFKYE